MSEEIKKLMNLFQEYQTGIKKELALRWNLWPISLERQILFQVIGGMLSRHISFTISFCSSTSNWNNQVEAVYYRLLSESYINLAWVLNKDQDERIKSFVEYGLGQEKLARENYKKELIKQDKFEEVKDVFEKREAFFDQFRYSNHTDVVLPSWPGKVNLRKRCEEVGELAMYDLLIAPINDVLHGSYNVLLENYMKQTSNPLHKHFMLPTINSFNATIDSPLKIALLMELTFICTDKYFGIDPTWKSSYLKLVEGIDLFENESVSKTNS